MAADVYAEKDFVEVVDKDGNPIEFHSSPVPKAWIGSDLLPAGAKPKPRSKSSQPTAASGADKPAVADGEDDKTEPEGS